MQQRVGGVHSPDDPAAGLPDTQAISFAILCLVQVTFHMNEQ